ncbi:class C sortase [Bifidobacterium sp. ESL0800]|uniref:class C sortase n=1 Tax=Bifidobacterium sp. ESL0800 TaxID=2983236 RepID=UPI0023FA0C65|nr:class C sortase [Bifidobacterium sp. ESL0800]WEV75454.1 class C sortase [Bifidobacterium sp. ESL0800]
MGLAGGDVADAADVADVADVSAVAVESDGSVGSAEPSASVAEGSAARHAKARKPRSLIDVAIFVVGLAIFLYPLVADYVNYRQPQAAIDAYDAIVSKLSPSAQRKMWNDAKSYNAEIGRLPVRDPFRSGDIKAPFNRYYKTLNVDGKGMMGYVDIPKIHVKLPIEHGTSDKALANATGHLATTPLPTDDTGIQPVVTGHTGLVGHILFDNLTQLRRGDVFQIRVLNHRLSYRVDRISVVLPDDVSRLQPISGGNYVTLLTCTPYGVNDHRLLVRGHFVGEGVPATQPSGAPLWTMWLFLVLVMLAAVGMALARRRRARLSRILADALDRFEAQDEEFSDSSRLGRRHGSAGRLRAKIALLTALIWLLAFVALICAWASFGLMMRTGFLPVFNLGYAWFDAHVAYFFGLV